jgi:hypothetical protein
LKELKTTKNKELDFKITTDNYIKFLETILSKHSQDKYKVMEWRPYAFKYLYPPSKAYVVVCLSAVSALPSSCHKCCKCCRCGHEIRLDGYVPGLGECTAQKGQNIGGHEDGQAVLLPQCTFLFVLQLCGVLIIYNSA